MNKRTRHLDIGCGEVPRNPYKMDELHAMDSREIDSLKIVKEFKYQRHNFVIKKFPYPDGYFDSISAYDVIEHIPRQIMMGDELVYPFIRIMNEIHRTLKKGGKFIATTPGYPRPEDFQDPTHVNIITLETIKYFSGIDALGKMYGFEGDFEIKTNKFCVKESYVDMSISARKIFLRRWHRKIFKKGWSHIVWEIIKK